MLKINVFSSVGRSNKVKRRKNTFLDMISRIKISIHFNANYKKRKHLSLKA